MNNLNANIKIRMFEVFINKFTGSAILPFMTIYFTVNFGVKIASILVFLNIIFSIISSYVSGFIIDYVGRKEVLIISSTVKCLVFFLLVLTNSPYLHIPIFTFFMIIINTICSNLNDTSGQAMILDLSNNEQRKSIYSILYWIKNTALSLGGLLGILFFENHLFTLLCFLFFLSLANSIIVIKFLKDYEHRNTREYNLHFFHSYKKVLCDVKFMLFNLGSVLLLSLEVQLTNYISIKLYNEINNKKFFLWKLDGLQMVGILKVENTLLVVVLTISAYYWLKKTNNTKSLISGSVLFIIGFTFMSYTNNIYLLLISMFILTLGEVIYSPVIEYLSSLMVPKGAEGRYIAIKNLISEFTMISVPIILFLSSFLQYYFMTLLFLSIGIVGIFVMLIAINIKKALE